VDQWKSPRTWYKHGKVALKTTCIKNVKFKTFKIKTDCQNTDWLYCSENLNWAAHWTACSPWAGHSWFRNMHTMLL